MEKAYFSNQDQEDLLNAEPDSIVEWKAAEFAYHKKSPAWFVAVPAIALTISLLLFFIVSGGIFIFIVAAIISVCIVIVGNRKPQTVTYSLFPDGVGVSDEFHPFVSFTSFSLLSEVESFAVEFHPTKRTQLPITILFPTELTDRILPLLNSQLPLIRESNTLFDRFIRLFKI